MKLWIAALVALVGLQVVNSGGRLTGVGHTVTITVPTSAAIYDAGTSSTVAVSGTALSDRTVVSCTWTNSLGGSGTATGTAAWAIASVALTVGSNVVTVTCLNNAGTSAQDAITITRSSGSCSPSPCISAKSGTLTHGGAVTITGAGFGTKATAAPRVWDNAESGTAGSHWDSIGPTGAPETDCNLAYRTVIRSTAMAHSASNTRYISGCHSDPNGVLYIANDRTNSTFPNYSTWIWYTRMDPAWNNTGSNETDGSQTDGNNKIYQIAAVEVLTSPYWYFEYGDRPLTTSTSTSNISFDASDSGGLAHGDGTCNEGVGGACLCYSMIGGGNGTLCHSITNPNTVGYGAAPAANPINGWSHFMLTIRWDRNATGTVEMYENGTRRYRLTGVTDNLTSVNTRREAIGLYARAREPNSYRYIDDVYFDWGTTPTPLVLVCPGSTWAAHGDCEPQIPTAWADGSITFTVNRAHFGAAAGAFVYVSTASETQTAGFAVTFGS